MSEHWKLVALDVWSGLRWVMPLVLGLANIISCYETRNQGGYHYETSLPTVTLWWIGLIGTYLSIAQVWI